MKKIVLIVAVQAEDNGIGFDDKLLFSIPPDMQRFVKETMGDGPVGHPTIMGRKTWDSIDPRWRPLKDRPNYIITKDNTFRDKVPPNVVVVNSPLEAVEKAHLIDDVLYAAGGGEIYNEFMRLGLIDEIALTVVEGNKPANIFFDGWRNFGTEVIEFEGFHEKSGLKYRFSRIKKGI